MDREALVETWKQEERRPFTGWDFSYLAGRMLEDSPPWDYLARAAKLMDASSAALDIGTAGGERLLALREHWPARVVVTEDYPPNARLAGERLGPLGVQVVDVPPSEHDPLPFAAEEFDLVLNRHSGINFTEIARVLAPGGTFLTQQVHGLWAQDLLAEFGAGPQWPFATPAYYLPRLESAGLAIVQVEEWQGDLAFTDIGALVFYLRAVPWLVPGFSVDRHLDTLLRLQAQLAETGRLVYEARKYWMEAKKPAR